MKNTLKSNIEGWVVHTHELIQYIASDRHGLGLPQTPKVWTFSLMTAQPCLLPKHTDQEWLCGL